MLREWNVRAQSVQVGSENGMSSGSTMYERKARSLSIAGYFMLLAPDLYATHLVS